jgi:hypothetical protein
MKKLAVLLCAFGALTAYGQTTNLGGTLQTTPTQPGPPPPGLFRSPRANEIFHGNIVYSGVAVQVVKAHNPLQLFNPAAPPQYGSAQDNLDRDPTSIRTFGLKIFSLRF